MPHGLVVLFAGLLGAVVGSFLNVCVYRLPLGQSVVRPRSRCPMCARPIPWYENVPVLSWLALRGRCRGCGGRISVQYPLVELATALIWIAAAARTDAAVEALRMGCFFTILLGIAATDARHHLIPDHFSVGGVAIGLILAAIPGGFPLGDAALGLGVGGALFLALKLVADYGFRKPALGAGDVLLMAMIGTFVGWRGVVQTLFLGSALGLVIGVPYLLVRGEPKLLGSYLPFGTFLALAAAITYLWGEPIIDWYVGTVMAM
ncbi:MAG: prepilin peptidase [Gemmatimonadetes bacterium]|nr:prepilin peptidase [Gemmatimonadota bacterium]